MSVLFAQRQAPDSRYGFGQLVTVRVCGGSAVHQELFALVSALLTGRIGPLDEVRATAGAHGVPADFFAKMGHDMMLEPGWQAVAERIDSWLTAQGP
jgi:hypothetical protein